MYTIRDVAIVAAPLLLFNRYSREAEVVGDHRGDGDPIEGDCVVGVVGDDGAHLAAAAMGTSTHAICGASVNKNHAPHPQPIHGTSGNKKSAFMSGWRLLW